MVSAKPVGWRRPAFRPQTCGRRGKLCLQMGENLLNDHRIFNAGSYRAKVAGSQLRLYGGIDNLFDEKYDDNPRINAARGRFFEPAPERSFVLGVSVTGRPG